MSNLKPLLTQPAWQIYGHEWAIEYLQRIVEADQTVGLTTVRSLRHAYLFVGPPQVGKSTVVRAFAQALLCTGNGDADARKPCGACRSCQLMQRGLNPDFRVVAPTDSDGNVDRTNGKLLSEQAGEFIHDLSLRPVESRYKIFLIQDAQLARTEFSNKVLKSLEEPPDHVVICVTATDRSQLLPTVVSRCEVLDLRPIPATTARDALMQKWQVEPEQAELLARLCGGRLGWAVRQLDNKAEVQQRLEMLTELQNLVTANRVERLRFAETTASNRDNVRLFTMLELWVSWWRDVLLAQHDCVDVISNLDQKTMIEQQANQVPAAAVQQHLEMLKRVEQYLHHTVNTRLAMDALLLNIPRPVM